MDLILDNRNILTIISYALVLIETCCAGWKQLLASAGQSGLYAATVEGGCLKH